jgi:hypothetical protein
MNNRYEVEVRVKYRVTAPSIAKAYEAINEGAEFPVVPWDDETYCFDIAITSVKEVKEETDA